MPKFIKFDSKFMKTEHDVHHQTSKDISQRKTLYRLLHENYLVGEKWNYAITVDEAWIYLSDCNRNRSN